MANKHVFLFANTSEQVIKSLNILMSLNITVIIADAKSQISQN